MPAASDLSLSGSAAPVVDHFIRLLSCNAVVMRFNRQLIYNFDASFQLVLCCLRNLAGGALTLSTW